MCLQKESPTKQIFCSNPPQWRLALSTNPLLVGEQRSHLELDPNLSALCLLSPLAMMMEIRREGEETEDVMKTPRSDGNQKFSLCLSVKYAEMLAGSIELYMTYYPHSPLI